MEEIPVTEFKATCLKIISKIKLTGESLIITKNGKPAAIICPPPPENSSSKKLFGAMKDAGSITGDIMSPLDDIKWDALK
jgi:antitoxin (DNA-binding transcriptional repressor) of toxin-antitoxin stability system